MPFVHITRYGMLWSARADLKLCCVIPGVYGAANYWKSGILRAAIGVWKRGSSKRHVPVPPIHVSALPGGLSLTVCSSLQINLAGDRYMVNPGCRDRFLKNFLDSPHRTQHIISHANVSDLPSGESWHCPARFWSAPSMSWLPFNLP